MAETAGTTLGFDELFDHFKMRLNYRYQHQLGQAFAYYHVEIGLATVPARHHQRALVIGVDQADQIAQHDAVFMAKA